eukprot:scaffold24831_cov61-Attheya_sp.AAC.2
MPSRWEEERQRERAASHGGCTAPLYMPGRETEGACRVPWGMYRSTLHAEVVRGREREGACHVPWGCTAPLHMPSRLEEEKERERAASHGG